MTALFGTLRSFSLMLARARVGIGEAALSPTALSLIADKLPASRHGLMIAIYYVMGGMAGTAAAVGFGGEVYTWLRFYSTIAVPHFGSVQPWQACCLLLAAAFLQIAEPARRVIGAEQSAGAMAFYGSCGTLIVLHHSANEAVWTSRCSA